jgi:hypothetical protein
VQVLSFASTEWNPVDRQYRRTTLDADDPWRKAKAELFDRYSRRPCGQKMSKFMDKY